MKNLITKMAMTLAIVLALVFTLATTPAYASDLFLFNIGR